MPRINIGVYKGFYSFMKDLIYGSGGGELYYLKCHSPNLQMASQLWPTRVYDNMVGCLTLMDTTALRSQRPCV